MFRRKRNIIFRDVGITLVCFFFFSFLLKEEKIIEIKTLVMLYSYADLHLVDGG